MIVGLRTKRLAHTWLAAAVLASSSGGLAGCARIAGLGEGDLAAAPGDGGQPGDPNVDISDVPLEFGENPCGAEAPTSKIIAIHNKSAGDVAWAAVVPVGTAFRIDGPTSGTAHANQVVTIPVFVTPRLAGDDSADLIITAGAAVRTVKASTKGIGPTMELVQSAIAYGDVRKENGGPATPVEVLNKGNAPLSVSGFTSDNPAFIVGPLATIAPGASGTFTVALDVAKNEDAAPLSGTIKPNVTKICGGVPLLSVTGRRVTTDVSVGALDWGRQPCGTAPETRDLTISSYAAGSVSFSMSQSATSAFTVVMPPQTVLSGGSSAAPATAIVKVTPKPLGVTAPLAELTEDLVFSFTGAVDYSGPNAKKAPLHVAPHGVILTMDKAALSFSGKGSQPFQLKNEGNDNVGLLWDLAGSSAFRANPNFPVLNVNAGSALPITVDFNPTQGGTFTATLRPVQAFYSSMPICGMPPSLALSGKN
ncbi:MAG: Ig family protein [Labilithrix sp.]|nr:Ig family protein [Labilithrix sp.]